MKIACGATSRLKLRVSASLLVGTFFFKSPHSLVYAKKKKKIDIKFDVVYKVIDHLPLYKIGTDRSYSLL